MSAEIKFGTDGWRAVMCEAFVASDVRRVVAAIAQVVCEAGSADRGLVIGYDGRFFGERFARHAAEVLTGAGLQVLMPSRDLPTPVIAHAVVEQQAAGALMFTASHNPPEYNGVKFIPEFGGPAPTEVTQAIERHLAELGMDEPASLPYATAKQQGLVQPLDPLPAYRRHLLGLVDVGAIRAANLRVVYDAMHGAARGILDELLREAGAKVIALRQTRDPLFGGHPPEPLPDHLRDLQAAMAEHDAHLGLATDGDADRFGVVDGIGAGDTRSLTTWTGRYVTPNEVISLLADHLARHRGGAPARPTGTRPGLVRTVATTHRLDRIGAHYGLPVHETPVGFKHICTRMRQEDVLIGGEESGGLSIGGHIPEKDGLLADLLVVEARAVAGRSLGAQLEALDAEVGPSVARRLDLPLPDAQKTALLDRLRTAPPERLGGLAVREQTTLDGVKLLLEDDAWVLVRPSGTEPLVRAYLEAPAAPRLRRLQADVEALVAGA